MLGRRMATFECLLCHRMVMCVVLCVAWRRMIMLCRRMATCECLLRHRMAMCVVLCVAWRRMIGLCRHMARVLVVPSHGDERGIVPSHGDVLPPAMVLVKICHEQRQSGVVAWSQPIACIAKPLWRSAVGRDYSWCCCVALCWRHASLCVDAGGAVLAVPSHGDARVIVPSHGDV